jgi:hypothetical protein
MFEALQPRPLRHRAAMLAGAAAVSAAAAATLPPAAAAVVAGVAVLLCGRPVAPADPRDHPLRRHLAICRRREERAFVLVASAPGRRAMTGELRISDSAVAASYRGDATLVAVVDGEELARDRITERLRAAHGQELTIGWAAFPDDGLTLDALVDAASARAGETRAGRPAARRSAGRSP